MEIVPSLFGPSALRLAVHAHSSTCTSVHHVSARSEQEEEAGEGGLFGRRLINQALCCTLRAIVAEENKMRGRGGGG